MKKNRKIRLTFLPFFQKETDLATCSDLQFCFLEFHFHTVEHTTIEKYKAWSVYFTILNFSIIFNYEV
jgi:hypothetical protein